MRLAFSSLAVAMKNQVIVILKIATSSAAAFGQIITRSIYPYCAYLLMYFVCIHTYSLLAHDRFHVI